MQEKAFVDKQKNETLSFYANTHPMLTRAAVKRRHTDAQVARVVVGHAVESETDNSENVTAFDSYAKLNNIIERTYHCVVDKKKKKKLSHSSRTKVLPAEPNKVGIKVKPVVPAAYGDRVWIYTNKDGKQDARFTAAKVAISAGEKEIIYRKTSANIGTNYHQSGNINSSIFRCNTPRDEEASTQQEP